MTVSMIFLEAYNDAVGFFLSRRNSDLIAMSSLYELPQRFFLV